MNTNVRLATQTDGTDMGKHGTCSLQFQHCRTEASAMPFMHSLHWQCVSVARLMRTFRLGVEHFECELLVTCTFVFAVVCKISPEQSALESLVNLPLPRKEVGKTCHAAELQQ